MTFNHLEYTIPSEHHTLRNDSKPDIKIAFFDVDGTLRSFKEHIISQETKDAIRELRQNGIKVIVATGRQYFQLAGMTDGMEWDGYILSNGQHCLLEGADVRKQFINSEDVARFVEIGKTKEYVIRYALEDKFYVNMLTEKMIMEFNAAIVEAPTGVDLDEININRLLQLSVDVHEEEEHALMHNMRYSTIVRWHPDMVDIIPIDGGKGVGVQSILDALGMDARNAIAFGDGGNDVSMFETVGIGVAMGNGDAKAKGAADYITQHVDEHGLVNGLRHFQLI
ncbi:MAG: Cof-type HAD-IIB family hydrolase [Clostridiales Family XIII bacterium]|jgi:Cof subfamily protein (haloacid dehalogenase superfamily)|nr:Cof-type HAD-IIB family hydrolase [Clostridiales Family XIII bacterium]